MASIASGENKLLNLPAAEGTAHGVQGGADVVGQILAAETEIDQDPLADLAPRLFHDAQQGSGDALFHPFCRQLQIAVLNIIQAIDDHPQ